MRLFTRPLQIIRGNLRAYLATNVFVYGLILSGMAVGALFPTITASRNASVVAGGSLDDVAFLLARTGVAATR
ncbi:hypothetical protein GY21_08685 [Cryobacterium roopkundense]|uniref:Uncharacterized protein n=1 Tax=Cryobacterium roopkundense TaxID=1001240 RepID=A0A099JFJ0_9MICO|nr:hypothetical protein [Cryobacterium roopkundense]KGJ76981.1 hypothetical protein GY21_08685 [Cryobacterium roopkundense]MBB5640537.1 hypothetical protein [Cryobacterium roopkundense]